MSTLERELNKMGLVRPDQSPSARPAVSRAALEAAVRARKQNELAREALAAEQLVRLEAERAKSAHKDAMAALRTAKLQQAAAAKTQATRRKWLVYSAVGFVVSFALLVAGISLSRSVLAAEELKQHQQSNAGMICTDGVGIANRSASILDWFISGNRFRCDNWETSEARKARQQAADEARYEMRERAKRLAYSDDE